MMKKFCALIFAAVLLGVLLMLAGCNQNATEPSQNMEGTAPSMESTPTEPSDPTQSTGTEDVVDATGNCEPTDPTEPTATTEPTTETTAPTEPTEPVEPTEPAEPTEPVEPTEPAEPTEPDESDKMTYERFHQLSKEEQTAFRNSFDSLADYIVWYNAAKAEYEAQHPGTDYGDGTIDLGGGTGGNGG